MDFGFTYMHMDFQKFWIFAIPIWVFGKLDFWIWAISIMSSSGSGDGDGESKLYKCPYENETRVTISGARNLKMFVLNKVLRNYFDS